jgi:hypothetical protein
LEDVSTEMTVFRFFQAFFNVTVPAALRFLPFLIFFSNVIVETDMFPETLMMFS